MKKLLIAFSFAFCVISMASAQKKPVITPQERAAKAIARMSDLNLTADQQAKLTAIYVAQNVTADSIRAANPDADRVALREKMGEVMKASKKQIGSILTDAQKKQMAEKIAAAKAGNTK